MRILTTTLLFSIQLTLCCGITIDPDPIHVIDGLESDLHRPEGLSFSPDGSQIAVANSSNNSITIHRQVNGESCHYETAPIQTFFHSNKIAYPHDIDYHPDGNSLLVVNRVLQQVSFYKLVNEKLTENGFSRIKGKKNGLMNPASGSFSTDQKLLAVANRGPQGFISIYLANNKGKFQGKPFQIIPKEVYDTYQVTAPHGIAFSKDGNFLATVHKKFNADDKGESALVILEKEINSNGKITFSVRSILYYGDACVHSVAFHPSGEFLAITNELNDVIILAKSQDTNEFHEIQKIAIEKFDHFEGPKGIAFSKNGDCLGVTTMKPSIMFFRVNQD